MAYRHIPTMTNSHHGGFLSVMIMVGICQWQNPTIDEDDEELQLFNQLTQFNLSQVYFQLFREGEEDDEGGEAVVGHPTR